MLKNPTSKLKADVTGGDRVREPRRRRSTTRLRAACSTITTTSSTTACRFDDNAVYNTTFTLTDISKVDYFHPSVAGQAKLAAVTYTAFGFPAG